MARTQIVSLGSINIDYQMRVPRWPEPGETLIGADLLRIGGGKAANVAYLARRLGADAVLIGHVGRDADGDTALAGLQAAGVDLTHVQRLADAATGLAAVFVRPDGEKTIVLAPNANDRWHDAQAEAGTAAIERAPAGAVLVIDLEVPRFVVERAMRAARRRGLRTVLDPSPAQALAPELLALADAVTPNASEAAQLANRPVQSPDEAFEAGQALIEGGAGAAFVKLATGACVVVTREDRFAVTGFRVPVVDKTGAGDAFAGALAVALLERMPLERAARFALAAGNLAVARYGSQPGYPARDEVDTLVSKRAGTDGEGVAHRLPAR